MSPVRGEVHELDLTGFHELGRWEKRPALVVSADFFNSRLETVVLVPLTSQLGRAEDGGCVLVPRGSIRGRPGLDTDSVALCHSPLTVPQDLLGGLRGVVRDDRLLSDIEEELAFALGLGPALS